MEIYVEDRCHPHDRHLHLSLGVSDVHLSVGFKAILFLNLLNNSICRAICHRDEGVVQERVHLTQNQFDLLLLTFLMFQEPGAKRSRDSDGGSELESHKSLKPDASAESESGAEAKALA